MENQKPPLIKKVKERVMPPTELYTIFNIKKSKQQKRKQPLYAPPDGKVSYRSEPTDGTESSPILVKYTC
jgi:hypothetical protein